MQPYQALAVRVRHARIQNQLPVESMTIHVEPIDPVVEPTVHEPRDELVCVAERGGERARCLSG